MSELTKQISIDCVATLLIAHSVAERGDFYRFDVEGARVKAEAFRIYNEPSSPHDRAVREAALKVANTAVETLVKLGWTSPHG
jgi:hypothetical protein